MKDSEESLNVMGRALSRRPLHGPRPQPEL